MKLNKILIILTFIFTLGFNSYSQCPLGTYAPISGGDVTPPSLGTLTVTGPTAGDYIGVNVIAGNVYTFSTCNGNTYDTYLTLWDDGGGLIDFNDDGPTCASQSTITWTATYTGVVYLQLTEYISFFNVCGTNSTSTQIEITSSPPVQTGNGCSTDITICTPGVAGPFGFSTPGNPVSSCLDFFGPNYAYVVLYITQSGPLEMLINGDATSGYMDVSVFSIPPGQDPCTAVNDVNNEISCNYATGSDGCNQIGTAFPCGSSVPSPNVTAGDVLFIVLENWSGTSTNFTLELAGLPAAQTGPPDATINEVTLCDTLGPTQITAANMGGSWSGAGGITATGIFNPSAVGPGTYTVNYDIGSAPCASSSTGNITVVACNQPCVITNFTANQGVCENPANVYDLTGDVTFTNAPASGTLTVTACDGTNQVFNAPFISPQAYTLNNLPANSAACSVTAVFSADPLCTQTINFNNQAPCDLPCIMTSINDTIGACDFVTNDFIRSGQITFTDAPTTGLLIFTDCLGNADTIVPPFTSPASYSLTINSNGTANCDITATFTADPACTISIAQNYPVSCACPADAGTTSAGVFGSGQNNYVLCSGDTIVLVGDGNEINPNDVGTIGGSTYNPGITYGIYSCPPTPNTNPELDACFTGYVTGTIGSFGDINDGSLLAFLVGQGNTFINNIIYYAPITLYNQDDLVYNPNCVDVGLPIAVQYLPQVISSNPTEDCPNGTFTITINGGLPELDGSNFTASNLLPATASFVNTTTTNGGTIQINGLQNGDNYSFDVSDANGCPITITGGPFVGLPTANAGQNDTSCTLTYNLNATPSIGTGTWTGPANVNFAPVNSPTATATSTLAGSFDLYWTESNGAGCSTTDTVNITFLNPITTLVVEDCQDSSITVTISNGLPEQDGSNYTVSNLLPASSYFTTSVATHGADVIAQGLQDGDMYSFDISDNFGCTTSIAGGPFVGLPTANAGQNDTSCTLTYSLNATPSIGTGTWTGPANVNFAPVNSPTATATSTLAGSFDLYWTESNGAGCSTTDTVNITFLNPITTLVVEDCQDSSITVTISNGLPEQDGSTYTVSNLLPASSYFTTSVATHGADVIAQGLQDGDMYSFDISDNFGCTTSIAGGPFVGLPTANAGQNDTSCTLTYSLNATPSIGTGTWTGPANVNFAPVNSPTATATSTLAGSFDLYWTESNGAGCSTTDTVNITFLNPITTLVVEDCQDSSITVTISNGLPEQDVSNYTVSNLLPASSYFTTSVATHGADVIAQGLQDGDMYSFDISDNFGCTTSIAGGPFVGLPTANAGQNDTSCTLTYNLNAIPSIGTGTWTGPANISFSDATSPTATATSTTAGIYTLTWTETNTLSCTDAQSINITFTQMSIPNVLTHISCNGGNNGQVVVAPQGGIAPYTYSWSTSSNITPVENNLSAGVVTVTVTDAAGCTLDSTFTLTQPAAFDVTITSTTMVTCNGGNDGQATANVADIIDTYTYSWNTVPIQNTATATNLTEGTYTVVATQTSSGCIDTTTVTITEPTIVTIATISNDTTICSGQSTTITATATGGSGSGYIYTWDNGLGNGQNQTVTPAAGTTTTYQVSAVDGNNCPSNTQQVTVTVHPNLSVIASVDQNICPTTSTTISATPSFGNGGPYTYSWTPNTNISSTTAQSPTVTPTVTTTYTVTLSDGCSPTVTDDVTITLWPLPQPLASSDTLNLCIEPRQAITFYNITDTTNGMLDTNSVIWNFGDGTIASQPWDTISHTYNQPGTYTVTMTVNSTPSQGGCPNTQTVISQIDIYELPIADFIATPEITSMFEPEIQFADQSGSTIQYWYWDFAGLDSSNYSNPLYIFPDDTNGIYPVTLTVTDLHGCVDDITKMVTITGEYGIYIPNAFTPDSDGKNDQFEPKGFGISPENYHFMIFDRWGEKMFDTDTLFKPWDGFYKGTRVQEGVYVWKLFFKDINKKKHELIGHVTIIQ